MPIPKEIVVAVIGILPALGASIVGALAQRHGALQKTREIDLLEKKVDVIQRLLALDQHLPDDRRKMLQAELAAIAQDLLADRAREHAASGTVVEQLSKLRRVLLIYEQPTTRASIYRGLFWFLWALPVLVALTLISEPRDSDLWLGVVFSIVFYGAIGLVFRSAAIRQRKGSRAAADGK